MTIAIQTNKSRESKIQTFSNVQFDVISPDKNCSLPRPSRCLSTQILSSLKYKNHTKPLSDTAEETNTLATISLKIIFQLFAYQNSLTCPSSYQIQ